MLRSSPTIQKRLPSIVTELNRDEYAMRFVIRHRKDWRKMEPLQRATVLLAAAAQMEAWAGQMRDEAGETTSELE